MTRRPLQPLAARSCSPDGRRWRALGALAAALLLSSSASAQRPPVDAIEVAFGVSGIEAVAGNGRLTAGVSPVGDLVVLSWPSPSFYDQVHALHANGVGARDLERFGLEPSMGVFAGLVFRQAGADTLQTTWLHDEEWEPTVTYRSDEAAVIETRFEHPALGLTVVQSEAVAVDGDLLPRRYEVERASDSDIDEAWLLFYENLSPGLSKIPKVPMAGVLLDHKNDFLAAWDAERDQLVHFHPGDTGVVSALLGALDPIERDFGPLGALLADEELDVASLDDVLDDLDGSYGAGVYAVIATEPAADQVQVGGDTTATCAAIDRFVDNLDAVPGLFNNEPLPVDTSAFDQVRCGDFSPLADPALEEGWSAPPTDAFLDAQDGALEGARLAGAQVNAALRVPLSFEPGGGGADVAVAEVYLAFGETHAAARDLAAAARDTGAEAVFAARTDDDEAYVQSLRMPAGASDDLIAFSKRALLNIRVGTDAESGAIVASVSRQPPYQLDWPRDGAFFNAALDVAGDDEAVTKHMRFYADVMRDETSPYVPLVDQPTPGWPDCEECTGYPADSYEMNYYADGVTGGNIRLEIDNTGLVVWTAVSHVGYVEEGERDAYIEEIWPMVRRGATFLAEWEDERTGLIWPANEDDHSVFTQGLQGSVTVFGALRAAAMMASYLGEDELVSAWTARAGELRDVLIEEMYDEELGWIAFPLKRDDDEPKPLLGGAEAWLAWPAKVLPYDDPRVSEQLTHGLEALMEKVEGKGPGGSYTTKTGVSAALALPDGPARDRARDMAEHLASEVANLRTRQLGETFLNLDHDGDGDTDEQRSAVAPPHLWAATLVYLNAMAYYEPETFDAYEEVLPEVFIPGDPVAPDHDDEPAPLCRCTRSSGGGLVGLALLFGGLALAARLRSRFGAKAPTRGPGRR